MTTIIVRNSPSQLNGNMPEVGSSAPNFVLVNMQLKNHSLKNYSDKPILMFTYPSIDTNTCANSTHWLNDFAQNHPEINCIVVSADLPFAMTRFCTEHDLQHIKCLSQMRNKQFGLDYGVEIAEGVMQGILARAVFIIDTKKQITYQELVVNTSDLPDFAKIEENLPC